MDDYRRGDYPRQWDGETGSSPGGQARGFPPVRGGGRAEDGSGVLRDDPEDIKDWQKACWKGPRPPMLNPFEEPTSAPELEEERSDNLYDRSGDFWQGNPVGYPGPQSGQRADRRAEQKKREDRSGTLKAVLISPAVIVIAAVVLCFFVFRVRHITVTGNRSVSGEEIIAMSGIKPGSDILSLTQEDVAARINNDYRLQFMYMEKQLPDEVILCVREREPVSCFTFCGILYIMDKHRVVLGETEHDDSLSNGLIFVDGMDIRGGCATGQTLVLNSAAQEKAYESLIVELKVMDCFDQVLEMNLTDPGSIMLTVSSETPQDGTGTEAGTFTAVIGGIDNLHAKLRAMMLVRQEVMKMGYKEGTITVSTPARPVFSP